MYKRYLLLLLSPYHKDVFLFSVTSLTEASKVVICLMVLNMHPALVTFHLIIENNWLYEPGAHKILICPFANVAMYPVCEYVYAYMCVDGYLHVSVYILICIYLFSLIYLCTWALLFFYFKWCTIYGWYVQCNCCSTWAINLFSLSFFIVRSQFPFIIHTFTKYILLRITRFPMSHIYLHDFYMPR